MNKSSTSPSTVYLNKLGLMFRNVKLLIIWLFFFFMPGFISNILAQTTVTFDREYWLALPTTSVTYRAGSAFRISTFDQAATVTLSAPLIPGVLPKTVTLAPNSTGNIFLTDEEVAQLTNDGGNTVASTGVRIETNARISIYYEPGSLSASPDLVPLKGSQALGTEFLVPMQQETPVNAGSTHGYLILATEDNTTITITPKTDIVGHSAGVPFAITLQRGQTYFAQTIGTQPSLSGSMVTSDKPVAITIYSELMSYLSPSGAGAADLGAEQIVPIKNIGTDYIIIRGYRNPTDVVYFTAVENGTQITVNGTPVATLNATETYTLYTQSTDAFYVQASKKVTALQLSAVDAEQGISMLPAQLGCNGSNIVRAIRVNPTAFYINVASPTATGFTVNGNTTLLAPSVFQPIPGTTWYYARVEVPNTLVAAGDVVDVSNSSPDVRFHLGAFHTNGGGARFGYFSSYVGTVLNFAEAEKEVCVGQSVSFTPQIVSSDPISSYTWLNSSGSEVSNEEVLTLENVTVANSGTYTLRIGSGNCAIEESVQLTVHELPNVPISGGDQEERATNPIQTLTATATLPNGAPTGASVVWYDAPTGGSVVTSPILNAIGTVTYYAETVINGICPSVSRTAVKLTILSDVEICGNGIDDDGNGLADCDDPACNPYVNYFANGSLESYSQCPNLSQAGTMAYVTSWKTSLPAPDQSGGQLMVNDPTKGCISPRPATSWLATTNLPAGSDGVAWAGMHGGAPNAGFEDFQNTLIAPLPAGTYTFTFSAGYLVNAPYTAPGYFKFYGVMPGEADFTTAHPLGDSPMINNAISSTNPTWKEYSFSFTSTGVFDRIYMVAYSSPTGRSYLVFDGFKMVYNPPTIGFQNPLATCLPDAIIEVKNPDPAWASYQWYMDGELLAGATGVSYQPTTGQLGVFTVSGVLASGCASAPSAGITLGSDCPIPFECNGSAYLVSTTAANVPSILSIVDATNPNTVHATFTPSIANAYNGIGFNFEDNLIYGYASVSGPSLNPGDIVQFDATGAVRRLGVPTPVPGQAPGLPSWTTNAAVNANGGIVNLAPGVVGLNNKFYGMVTTNITTNRYLVTVDLTTMTYTTVKLSGNYIPADLAFSPYDGMLYGLAGNVLIRTNPNNGNQQAVTPTSGTLPPNVGAGGAWNDVLGRVYFFANGGAPADGGGRLYRYNPANGVFVNMMAVTPYPGFDATACFPTRLEKKVLMPTEGLKPGDTVEFEFSIYNSQMLPMTYEFEDILTSTDLSWVPNTVNPATPGGGTVSINGNTLRISGITVPPAPASGGEPLRFKVSLKVADNAAYGTCYTNQATIKVGGITVLSDNPETPEANDPTGFCLNPCKMPELVITNPAPVCLPSTINLTDPAITAGSSADAILSYFSDEAATVELSDPTAIAISGTYYIKATTPSTECNVIMPVVVQVIGSPKITISQPTCNGGTGSITITEPLGAVYTYSIDGTNYQADPFFGSLSPGIYQVTARSTETNCVSQAIEAEILSSPSAPTITVTQPTCDVFSGTISIAPYDNATYSIDGMAFWPHSTFGGLASGTYVVQVKDANGCISAPVQVTINNPPPAPDAPIGGGNQVVCEIDFTTPLRATANVGAGQTLIWYDAPVGGNVITDPILDTVGTVIYYAEAHNGICPSSMRTGVILSVEASPNIAPLDNQTVCGLFVLPAIQGTNLTGNEAYYTGQGGTGTKYAVGDTITTVGTSTLYMYDKTEAKVNCAGSLSVARSTRLTQASFAAVYTQAHYLYDGYDPNFWNGTANAIVNYSASDPVELDQTYKAIAGDIALTGAPECFGTDVRITARVSLRNNGPGIGAGYTGRISILNNETSKQLYTSSFNATPVGATVNLNITGLVPLIDVAAGKITIVIIAETHHSIYNKNWTISSFDADYQFVPETTASCADEEPFSIQINEMPEVVIPTTDLVVCEPATVDLTAPAVTQGSTPGLTFSYFTNANATTTLTNPNAVGQTGTYYIVGTTVAGCSDTAAVNVQIVSIPEVKVSHPTCVVATGSIEITAPLGAGIDYSIDGTNYQTELLFDNLAPGTYSVTARNTAAGCVSDPLQVTINLNPTTPTPDIVQPDCDISTGTVTFPAGANLEYAIDGGAYSSQNVFENLQPGTYSFSVRHIDINCVADAIDVIINPQPIRPAAPTSGGDQEVCAEAPIQTLRASASGAAGTSIAWYDAATGGNLVADPILNAIGTITFYAAAKDDAFGCESLERTPVTLTIHELPIVSAGDDQTQYNSGVFTLDAATTVGVGQWSVISGTPSVAISDINDPNATITLDPNTTVTLRWTVTNGTCSLYDEVVLNYTSQADIVTVKVTSEAGKTTYTPGESVDYTITVRNNGPSDAAAVNVKDTAPVGTTITNWTAVVTTGTVTLPNVNGTGDINETIATLPNGAVVTYTVTVQTPSGFTGELVNAVAVTTPTEDPDPSCPACTTPPLTPEPKADIVTVKVTSEAGKTTYTPGESVDYTITVTNNGPSDASAVNVKDTAPVGTTITSWTAAVTTGTVTLPNTSGTGNINETIATLPNGAVVTYTVTVQTPSGFTGELVNAVAVTTPTEDPDPSCPQCTTPPLTPEPKADIVTVKVTSEAGKTTYTPGESVDYTITVTNNGPSDAAAVNVKDTAPVGTTITSWSAAVTTGTVTLPNVNGTGDINETIATLPNGAVVTYTVTVQTPSGFTGELVNAVAVTTPTEDPDPSCPACTTPPLTPEPKADIVTVKVTSETGKTTYTPGESVDYTLTVRNNGPSNAAAVNVKDTAPVGTTITNWTAVVTTGTVTLPNVNGTGDINETIATLPNGAVVTYTVTVQTPSSFTGELVNAVAVTTPTEDPDPSCPQCTTPPLTPEPKADIVTVKVTSEAGKTTYTPGESVDYTITVTNNGPSDAAAVNINDTAPAGTTISNWSAVVTTGTVTLPNTSGTGDINETIATLPNGAVVTYTVTVQTPSSFTGELVNAVAVTTPTEDPDPSCPACTTPPLTPEPKADIVTVKVTSEAGKTTYTPGESVDYTITVRNNGPSDAATVNINDTAPSGTTISNWSAVVTTGTVTLPNTSGTGDINETIATLPNGAVVTYTVTVQTPSSFTGELVNAVAVTTPTEDPDPSCPQCETPPLTPEPKADIVTVKVTSEAGKTTYTPGESVDYTITVTNNGPSDAAAVNINDTAPAGTTITNWSAAVTTGTVTLPNTSGTGNLNETIATLPNGAVVTYTVTVQTPSSFTGELVNAVAVTTPTEDPDPSCPQCTTPPLTPEPKADIVTVKVTSEAGKTTYTPGESVDYTITVTNNGPSDAAAVNINDTAPAGTTISNWSAVVTTGTVTLPNTSGTGNINETIATLPNGAVVTYTVTVQTPSDFTGELVNAVVVTTPTEDPDPSCPQCETPPLTPEPKADIVTVKVTSEAGKTTYIPGESVDYTITVTNNGPSDAAAVNINDTAPSGTTISNWTAVVTTGTVTLPNTSGTGNLNETITTLPNGAVVTYTVTVQTPSSFTGELVNAVAVTTPTEDPDPSCPQCETPPLTPEPKADIVTVKVTSEAGKTVFTPGESVDYTITVTNNGPSDAAAVNINDTAPAGTTISNWTAAVTTGTVTLPNTSGTGDINETIATLPNGAVVTYTVTVQTPSSFTGELVNAVAVTTPTEDPDPSCPACTTPPLTPEPKADIVTVKVTSEAGKTVFTPGESVDYTITVTNNGPSDAAAVNVKDTAPAGTTITNWAAAVTTGTVTLPNIGGTGDINETIAILPNGAVVTYTVTVQTPSGFTGELVNAVAVTTPTEDPDPSCPQCTTPPLTPEPKADIVTVKVTSEAGKTTYTPGESVDYTITVTNNGPSDAAAVNVKDTAPAGTTITSWTAAVTTGTVTLPNVNGTGNINETIATLPNGAVVTYTVTVQTPSGFTGELVNAVAVTTPTEDPDPSCPACTTPPLTPEPKADIVAVKVTSEAGKTVFTPGESVDYTITVTNNGPSDAAAVNVKDTAPVGTTITNWTAVVTTGTVTLPNVNGTGDINETIATLPNGAVVTYTVTVQTPSNFTGELVNAVAITTPTEDPDPSCPQCTTPPLTPEPKADIVTVKVTSEAGKTTYTPGESVDYTITVTNNGPSDAAAVNINDTAPAGTTITNWTAVVTTGTVTLPNTSGTGNLNETIATLPNGSVVTYTVTVQTPSGFTGELVNAVAVTTPTEDPDPECTSCTTPPLTPESKADIVTVKVTSEAGKMTYTPGESVDYTITVRNNGPSDAAAVNVKDTAPVGTTITNWTAAVTTGTVTLPNTSGTGNLNETIATLPNGAVVTYTVTVQTPSGFTGELVNAVAVTTPTEDPDPSCPACTTPPLTPEPKADIVTVKVTSEAGKTTYTPGESVDYTITVTNNGPSDAAAVNVKDTAPVGTTITNWTAAVTTGTVTLPNTSGTGNLNETIATLPNGAVVTYTVTVQTPSGFTGELVNAVAVTTPTEDPDPSCPACTTPPLTPEPKADIVAVKVTSEAGKTVFTPGESVDYTITVTNNGPSDAAAVNVKDTAPVGTTITNWTAVVTTGTVTLPNVNGTGNINETIATLPNGAVVTYTVRVQTPSGFTGELVNAVAVTTPTEDPDPSCPQCTTPPLTPEPKADIVTVKVMSETGKTMFTPGEAVDYTITVRNNGPSDAADVNVKDTAPAGTTISKWTAVVTTGTATLPNTNGTGNLNETIAVLPDGAVVTYTVTVQTPPNFTNNLVNAVVVTTPTEDPDPSCPQCETPPLPPNLIRDYSTSKSVVDASGNSKAEAGEELTYTISVENKGNVDLNGVTITDAIPAGTAYIDGSASNGGNLTGNILNWTVNVPYGETLNVSFKVKVSGNLTGISQIANTATVDDPNDPSNPEPQTPSSPAIETSQRRDYTSSKSVVDADGDGRTKAGEELTYTITVVNTGNVDLNGLQVVDPIPTGTSYVEASASNDGSLSGNAVNWTVNVPFGESLSVTFKVKVNDNVTGINEIINTASITDPSNPTGIHQEPSSPPVPVQILMPEASDDLRDTESGKPVTIPVLDNDSPGDANLDPSSFEIIEQPLHGTVTLGPDGTLIYTPEPGYTGTDTFKYRVKDENGNWTNVATVTITIKANPLKIPNAITPNGDGKNDLFNIIGLEGYDRAELIIFNRWGNEVYKSENYKNTWDGQGLNEGTYYYILRLFKGGNDESHKGWILLKRSY
jgi:gliding motility-associated-like protein/uncharacterized repeat protein (TIGR01451 family)